MSASYPAAVAVGKAKSLSGTTYSWSAGTWMVAFGSGSTDYADYYETGTAYYRHILPGTIASSTADGKTVERVNKKLFVGHGAPPPAAGFHVGRESGATAFLQMSIGEVVKISVETAFPIKSGIAAWRDKNK